MCEECKKKENEGLDLIRTDDVIKKLEGTLELREAEYDRLEKKRTEIQREMDKFVAEINLLRILLVDFRTIRETGKSFFG